MAKQTTPATAAAVHDAVDTAVLADEARAAASQRNRRLAVIAVGVATALSATFVVTVAHDTSIRSTDRELLAQWSNANAEYDCCFVEHPACAEGERAVFALRTRLQQRGAQPVAELLARMLGLADLEVVAGPGLQEVDGEIARCPTLH